MFRLQTTLASRLEETRGRSSGFDYLRIGLSVSVILWHTIRVCYGADVEALFWASPLRPLIYFILPSFFALSGFLVAGSLFRNSIPAFLALRAIRIFPALFCEVMLSALILGPALTAFSLTDYFSDPKFYSYFFNIIGHIQFRLPGLFLDNPYPDNVNLQLWTIPFELKCYIVITGLAIFGIVRRPWLLAISFSALTAALFVVTLMSPGLTLIDSGSPSGSAMVLSFLGGITLYVCRGRIPFAGRLAVLALAILWITLTLHGTEYLAALPIAYITIWLGLQNPTKLFFVAGADYSYGMYLYGFPMQQAFAQLLPQYRFWYLNFVLGVTASGIAAFLSWRFVESTIMNRKSSIVSYLDRQLQRPKQFWSQTTAK